MKEYNQLFATYTRVQEGYDKMNSKERDEYETRYHLSQIHRLLYILVDEKLKEKEDKNVKR